MKKQQGGALLIMLVIAVTMSGFAVLKFLNNNRVARDKVTTNALMQAKEALIGYAATYQDRNPNDVFGYLPCPDSDNDGIAETSCGTQNVSVIGHLPWKTLGLPPLRDGSRTCLWYAVSGRAKENPKTTVLNWDTIGQFEIKNVDGSTLASAGNHNTPWAIIFSPGTMVKGQSRNTLAGSECGGNTTANNTVSNFLENSGSLGTGNTTFVISTPESIYKNSHNGIHDSNSINNDRALWITSNDLFSRITKRDAFKNDINTMLDNLTTCRETKSSDAAFSAGWITASGSKGMDNIASLCPVSSWSTKQINVYTNWKDQLLYTQTIETVVN